MLGIFGAYFGYIWGMFWTYLGYIWGIFYLTPIPLRGVLCRSEVLTERDIPSLGVRTGGWAEVDVSAAVVVVVALGGGGGGGDISI